MHRKNTYIKIKETVKSMLENIQDGEINGETVFQTCNSLVESLKLIEVQNQIIKKMSYKIQTLRSNLNNCQKKIVMLKGKI